MDNPMLCQPRFALRFETLSNLALSSKIFAIEQWIKTQSIGYKVIRDLKPLLFKSIEDCIFNTVSSTGKFK
jgi:hypothetical protein